MNLKSMRVHCTSIQSILTCRNGSTEKQTNLVGLENNTTYVHTVKTADPMSIEHAR